MAACGGGTSGDTGGGGTGCTNGSCPVGTAGGTVSLPSGPVVVVPAGSLPANTTITVAASTATAPAGAVSSLYQFGPAGTTFTAPVTVSFPVPAGTRAADVAVYWTKPGSTTEWDVLPATVSGTTATASVTHFSIGFVGAACTTGAACSPANACHTGVTTCNGTPACADTGTSVADGAACGSGNVCTAGVCGAAQCTAGQACTPPTTPDVCKTYATTCDASGVQTCGVSGNAADGTSCGSGLACSSGTCGSSGSNDYFPADVATRYRATPPAPGAVFNEDYVPLTYTSPTSTVKMTASNRANYSVMTFVQSGGAVTVSGYVLHEVFGGTTTVSTYAYDPPMPVVPADTTPGATGSVTSTVTLTGVSGTTTFTEARSWTVNGIETVSVPAGTFSAVKITAVVTDPITPRTSVAWFVRGFGLVKSLAFENATPSRTTVLELSGYAPMNCSTGTCQPVACAAGTACTPAGTSDPCKTYATTCDAGGFQTCGVTGNAADGTSCGSGLTCTAGVCGSSGPQQNYFPAGTSRRYSVTPPPGSAAYAITDQSATTTATGGTRTLLYSNASTSQSRVFVYTGGEAALSSAVTYQVGSPATTVTYDPPLLLLPADQRPGATATRTSTGTQGTGTYTMTRAVTVNGIESVTVPAGTYSALKVTTRITSTLSGYAPSYAINWYAPDVGLVKAVTYAEATPSATTTQVLTGTTGMVCSAGSCACNDVVNGAPVVAGQNVPASLPSGLGGTIADGTYDLTGNYFYTGTGGASGSTGGTNQWTIVVAGGVIQGVNAVNGGTAFRGTATYTTSGTALTMTYGCGSAATPVAGYTATANELRFLHPDAANPTLGREGVYTLRGTAACVAGQSCTPANACHTGVTTCFGAPACADTGTPVTDGTTCGGTNYCSAGTCSRTVTITINTSYWDDTATDAPTTNVPVTTNAFWVNYVTVAGAQRIAATPSAAGSATYSVPGVPVGKYWIEGRGNGGANAPAYIETARDAVDFGRDRYGRADAVSAANPGMTQVTFNYSNMSPWVSGSDTVEAFSSNLGMVDYSFGAFGNSVEGWGPGATTGTGVHNWFAYTPLVEPAKGDTTYFTQLTTRSVAAGATNHTYSAVDRFHFSDAFAVVNRTPTTIDVPFVAPTASVPVPIDWRLSEYAALLPAIHPMAVSSGAGIAIQGQPHLLTASSAGPLVMNSWGGWPDMLSFVPVGWGTDINLGEVSFAQFLPASWGTFRVVQYDTTVNVLAQGATTPYVQGAGIYAYEAFPGATNPIRPLVTPVTAPLINGLDAYTARADVTATPTLSWTAPTVLPGAGSLNGYWVTLYQLGTNATGGTTSTFVTSVGGLTGTSFQVPPGFLVAGNEYYAIIEARAGGTGVDGAHLRQWLPMAFADTVTGVFSP